MWQDHRKAGFGGLGSDSDLRLCGLMELPSARAVVQLSLRLHSTARYEVDDALEITEQTEFRARGWHDAARSDAPARLTRPPLGVRLPAETDDLHRSDPPTLQGKSASSQWLRRCLGQEVVYTMGCAHGLPRSTRMTSAALYLMNHQIMARYSAHDPQQVQETGSGTTCATFGLVAGWNRPRKCRPRACPSNCHMLEQNVPTPCSKRSVAVTFARGCLRPSQSTLRAKCVRRSRDSFSQANRTTGNWRRSSRWTEKYNR